MKNLNSKIFLLLATCFFLAHMAKAQNGDTAIIRCVTTQRDSVQILKNPALLKLRQNSEQAIQQYIRSNKSSLRVAADDIITIPVVVHVIHDQVTNKIGGESNANISNEQVQSQIDVLNEDYSNTSGYKGFYTDSLGNDTGIRFKLVTVIRKYSTHGQFSPISDADVLASISPPWFTNRFLNIWVCSLSSRYLGSSQFPTVSEVTSQTSGLSTSDEDENYQLTDGVIIDYRYFGRNSPAITSTLYNLGRTTTHEIGHWLGLIHIWGDRYCGTDYCDDTPRAEDANQTTDVLCTPKFSNCGGVRSRNMIENYMDYSPDLCMSVFTSDQKARMQAVLALSPRRAKMVEYSKRTDKAVTVDLYPNPVSESLNANVYTPDYKVFSVTIFNSAGMRMTDDIPNWTNIDVKNYPSGIYFLQVSTDTEMVTKRFLVR